MSHSPIIHSALLILLLAGCKPSIAPAPMPTVTPEDRAKFATVFHDLAERRAKGLAANLAQLDALLQEKAPGAHAALLPGAGDAEIAELMADIGKDVPELATWFRWHNGASGAHGDIMVLGQQMAISHAIPAAEFVPRDCIYLLWDGTTGGYYLDLEGSLRVFYHEITEPEIEWHGDLTQFVIFICVAWEQDVLFEDRAPTGVGAHFGQLQALEEAYQEAIHK
jgi:hypothetical protein